MTNEKWIEEELKQLNTNNDYEKQPTLKLEENQITEIDIDSTKAFQKYTQDDNGIKTTKAIIPVIKNGMKYNWWLNLKNPIYSEIIRGLREGKNKLKVLRTGQQKSTKYVLVK